MMILNQPVSLFLEKITYNRQSGEAAQLYDL